ncbi:MAG TPA: lysophospholipid acyltransferase family protein [Pyrinomonadaceae bacterium]
MRERFPSVFTRGSLERFTFKERIAIYFADIAFYLSIKLIGLTLRYSTEGEHFYDEVLAAGKQPILAYWHERIFAGVYFFRDRNVVVLSSLSMDGEYTARFITRFGFGAIRGSSSRRSVQGLVEMIRLMRDANLPMAFAVDGPRGPRREAKKGPVMLAKKTGNPILPFVIECSSYWQVNKSWDRLQIPKPFSKARVFFAEPIYVPAEGGEAEIERWRIEMQSRLDDLAERGEAWRNSGAKEA